MLRRCVNARGSPGAVDFTGGVADVRELLGFRAGAAVDEAAAGLRGGRVVNWKGYGFEDKTRIKENAFISLIVLERVRGAC